MYKKENEYASATNIFHFVKEMCGDTHITAHLLPLSAKLPLAGFSLCSMPAKRSFSGAPASGTYSTSHAYQFC